MWLELFIEMQMMLAQTELTPLESKSSQVDSDKLFRDDLSSSTLLLPGCKGQRQCHQQAQHNFDATGHVVTGQKRLPATRS